MNDPSSTARRSPYKGLIPYAEADAPFFFGREKETRLIIANMFASPLTLLYGASGVGKSSVLRAGVAHQLRQRDDLIVVPFSAWQSNPVGDLVQAIAGCAGHNDPATDDEVPNHLNPGSPAFGSLSLPEYLQACYKQTGRRLMIILDQFEEYFLYHPQEDTFADEFPQAVLQADVPVSFLISIREDSLAKLDRFEGRIPTLFDNYLRVEHLGHQAARVAIVEPIKEYNRRYATAGQQFGVGEGLVEAVLQQVETGRVTIGDAGRGVIEFAPSQAEGEAQIETPFLQLVMTRLWDEERRLGSYKLRLETLNHLGGAENIVRTHLDDVIAALLPHDKEVAAGIFHYLVTPSGTKIAYTALDLAGSAELKEGDVVRVLEKLSHGDVRILRAVDSPLNRPRAPRYEIFHDVMAPAILTWCRGYVLARERAAAERLAEDERSRAEERARVEEKAKSVGRLRWLSISLGVMTLIVGLILLYALNQKTEARTEANNAKAQAGIAEEEKGKANAAKTEAEKQREKAKLATAEEKKQKSKVEGALAKAEEARKEALKQVEVAKKAEAKAAQAKSLAEKAFLELKSKEQQIVVLETEVFDARAGLSVLRTLRSSLASADPADNAGSLAKLQNIVAALEKDKDIAPLLKVADIASDETDGNKLLNGLIAIKRRLLNDSPLQDKINQAILKYGK